MRPRLFAAEIRRSVGRHLLRGDASTRPRLFAAEIIPSARIADGKFRRFHEAAAIRRGNLPGQRGCRSACRASRGRGYSPRKSLDLRHSARQVRLASMRPRLFAAEIAGGGARGPPDDSASRGRGYSPRKSCVGPACAAAQVEASMRPRLFAAEISLWRNTHPVGLQSFNEAAAIRRGNRGPSRIVSGAESASMRPRLFAAEISARLV